MLRPPLRLHPEVPGTAVGLGRAGHWGQLGSSNRRPGCMFTAAEQLTHQGGCKPAARDARLLVWMQAKAQRGSLAPPFWLSAAELWMLDAGELLAWHQL